MTEIQRDPATETFIDTLEHADVYRFMRSEHDRLSNDGDDYDAEAHDPEVAEAASKKFDISAEDAGNLYEEYEVKIADFWQNRKDN